MKRSFLLSEAMVLYLPVIPALGRMTDGAVGNLTVKEFIVPAQGTSWTFVPIFLELEQLLVSFICWHFCCLFTFHVTQNQSMNKKPKFYTGQRTRVLAFLKLFCITASDSTSVHFKSHSNYIPLSQRAHGP